MGLQIAMEHKNNDAHTHKTFLVTFNAANYLAWLYLVAPQPTGKATPRETTITTFEHRHQAAVSASLPSTLIPQILVETPLRLYKYGLVTCP